MSATPRTPPTQAPDAPRSIRPLLGDGTIHFAGVGGAGMCALAEAVVRAGGRVTGCDLNPGAGVRALERLGVRIQRGHDPSHLEGVTAVIASAALPADHPELQAARERGLPVLKRAEALGGWVNAGTLAAVAGTHGKTTTTAMLTSVLVAAGRNPTGFVGGEVPAWRSHLRPGSDELFVVEADEYDRSFLHLRPSVTVVTNLEADHLDIYGDLDGVREGFRSYLDGVRAEGTIWVCADDPGASALLPYAGARGRSYGFSAGSQLRGIDPVIEGVRSRVRVIEEGRDRGELELRVAGRHNLLNALGAAGAARSLGVEWEAIRAGLLEFGGVRRRFQLLGELGGIRVIDDYAHHPTEVEAALAAARAAYPGTRLVAVFQPHLFSRTRDFHREFASAFRASDVLWVTGIYPAREAPIEGIAAALVADSARKAGVGDVRHHEALDDLPEAVAADLRAGDLCLTLGAGSIERVGPRIVALLGGDDA
ncbi:MAG: UDP-N-acetylmuramate--L-alanine ligase [Gemmatimonadales bacterium]|nr:MAG: UDP-N-acetylmuramate--L-alanine ligase [Gemmatimonadales bacterium]